MKKLLSLTAGAAVFASAAVVQAGGIDVVFDIDESGSMSSAINNVKTNVEKIFSALPEGSHVGLVGYGAGYHGSDFNMSVPHLHLSLIENSDSNKTVFQNAVSQLVINGGTEPGYDAVFEATTDTLSKDWQGTPNPSLGFTGAPYCNILITDEELDQGTYGGQDTIDAMNAAGGHFFGIIGDALHDGVPIAQAEALAAATGGEVFDLYNFESNPQPVIDALMKFCVASASFEVENNDPDMLSETLPDGTVQKCLPRGETEITYSLTYKNLGKQDVTGVEVTHTNGTWGVATPPQTWPIGDVPAESDKLIEVTMEDVDLTDPNQDTFFHEFTLNIPSISKDITVPVCKNNAPIAQCKDATIILDSNGQAVLTSSLVDNGSSDPDGDPITFALSETDFTCTDIGAQHAVTLTVTDDGGLSDSCISNVTVVDNTAPDVKTKNVTVQINTRGTASITVDDIDNGSTDNCCIASRTIDKNSFTCSDLGENTVTLTVTDCNGNSGSAQATVTVEDKIAVQAGVRSMGMMYRHICGPQSLRRTLRYPSRQ